MPDNTVNPYAYMGAFPTPYSTGQAYIDIGAQPSQEFLNTRDPDTGLLYRDLIPDYDPYAEEEMRTEFRAGSKKAHQATIGEMAGITEQARMQRGASGFAGGGAGQAEMEQQRTGLERQYGQAFEGALLDLAGGIRGERQAYQEQLAGLLQSFGPTVWGDAAPIMPTGEFLPGAFHSGGFYFPNNPEELDEIKAPDGFTYVYNGSMWVLLEEESGGFDDDDTSTEEETTGITNYDTVPSEYTGADSITVNGVPYEWDTLSGTYLELEV